ncbi:gas vesicle protein [Kribbella sp. NPDC004875]|uniref:gas vesicle protein GvpO n=1 Tax=Kribbella sp. NPDC004875 TaxID=3364107 RepID=UPI0036B75FA8
MATPRKSTRSSSTGPARSGGTGRREPTARGAHNGQSGTARSGRLPMRAVAVNAARELADLIGRTAESIIGVEKQDSGWSVQVQVVESERIPATTDILAVYEVEVDDDGAVLGYRRTGRYVRGRIQE